MIILALSRSSDIDSLAKQYPDEILRQQDGSPMTTPLFTKHHANNS